MYSFIFREPKDAVVSLNNSLWFKPAQNISVFLQTKIWRQWDCVFNRIIQKTISVAEDEISFLTASGPTSTGLCKPNYVFDLHLVGLVFVLFNSSSFRCFFLYLQKCLEKC